MITNEELFGSPSGWVCPKCGRVYSPYTVMCYYCGGESTTTATSTFIASIKKFKGSKPYNPSDFWNTEVHKEN